MTLYINCCPRTESRTHRLAVELLNRLGEYEELKLYELGLQPIDEARLQKRNKLLAENSLDAEEFKLARQFAKADRIVIATPFWDLSFPATLKLYIENIYITGIVSKYDENGMPKGLCNAKELFYVTTSGGPYDARYSFDYLKTMCTDYFGIPKVELFKADMLDIVGNDSEEILDSAINESLIEKANQYYYGEGCDIDLVKAAKLYKDAADRGDAKGQCLYGYCLREGIGVEANLEEAFKLFSDSAQSGFPMAQYNLGYCYENGIGVLADDTLARSWYQKAKENGYEE